MTRFLAVIAGLLLSIFLQAQVSELRPVPGFFPYIKYIESVNGQAVSPNGQIVQDDMGFIWMPTNEGLLRYDGYELKPFFRSETDTTARLSDNLQKLTMSQDGRIFITSHYGGFSIFDPSTGKFQNWLPGVHDTVSYITRKVNDVVEDRDGSLWLVHRGLHHWHPENNSIQNFFPSKILGLTGDQANAADNVRVLRADPNHGNYLWLATEAGVMRFDKSTGELENYSGAFFENTSFVSNTPRDLYIGEDGKLYVGTWYNGLYIFDPQTGEMESYYVFGEKHDWELNNNIARIRKKSDDELWVVAPYRGLFTFNMVEKTFQLVSPHKSLGVLPAKSSYYLKGDPLGFLKDRDEAIWMHRIPIGLNVIHQQQQLFRKIVTGSSVKRVIPKPGTNELYLPAGDGQIHVYDLERHSLQAYKAEKNIFRNQLQAGAFSADGTFWLLGLNTFYELGNNGRAVPKSVPPFDSLQRVPDMQDNSHGSVLLIDGQQNMWVPLKRRGLLKVHLPSGNYTTLRFSHEAFGKDHNWMFPRDIIETGENRVWIAYGEGVCMTWDAGDTWIQYPFTSPNDKNIEFREISSLQTDRQGRLWMGSWMKGLFYLYRNQPHPQELHNITVEDGLPCNQIRDLELDASGHLWLVSDEGLSKMNTNDLTFEHFGPEYGLHGLRRMTLLPSGEMAVAAAGGFYLFHPDSVRIDTSGYLPIIHSFQVIGDTLQLDTATQYLSGIDLTHDQNFFTFEFSAPNFWAPHLVKYQYQLVGIDRQWVNAGDRRFANYTDISPGHYTFRVRASNVQGKWSEAYASLPLVIAPPWWQSWWAFTLYIVAAFTLLIGFFLYQRRRWELQTQLQIEHEKAERLKELDHFKSRFYTNITHEFRTPLTVIKGMAADIGNDKISSAIERNSNRLLNMVNQLLKLSKLENNSLPVNWVQGDIIPVLRYLTESCHSLAENKKLNLAFFSREDKLVMDFDETMLQQILINLLSNAIKFTPEYGSVKVIVAKANENGKPYMKIMVQDTGRGIPADKRLHIFDRFYQVDDSAVREAEGAGIGLALTKELVQLLEGRIEVESEVGAGSVFTVFLPIHHRATQAVAGLETIPKPVTATPGITVPVSKGEKPMILVIEDSLDVTAYIVSCLEQDYSLQTARNGKEGVDKALNSIPDVILCDVMMPLMDGFEVCRTLKSDRRTSHIPVVLLTAKATQEDKVTGLSQGADAYLIKPFDREELMVRLANLAAQSKRLQERLAGSLRDNDHPNEIEKREAEFLNELHQVVTIHMTNEQFDTQFLCRELAMSRTQLHRKLKALTGQSTAYYIRSFRLRKARSLLESTDLLIGEIATEVGYKDFSHFSRSFYKEFGVRPSEVRS